ncbi:MAG: hypothetical protein WBG71_02580 [Leeuwenhoekiella sp.]
MRWLYLFLCLSNWTSAQEITISVPLDTVTPALGNQFVGVDKYNNVYTQTGNTLHKTGVQKAVQFSDVQLGDITTVDLINPLRITLFYDQFNTAVIIDNTLNEITRVDFNRIENFKNVSHANTASDRQLWIFNVDSQRLELFDYRQERMALAFPPLRELAVAMVSDFNNCYVFTINKLYHYNRYGSLLEQQNIEPLEEMKMVEGRLFGRKKDKIFYLNGDQWTALTTAANDGNRFFIQGQILYIYRDGMLSYHSLNFSKT